MDIVLICPNCRTQIKADLTPGAIYTFVCEICGETTQVSISTKQPRPGPSETKIGGFILRDVAIVFAFLMMLLGSFVLDAGATPQPDRGATLWMWEQPRVSMTAVPAPELPVFVSPLPDAPKRAVFVSPLRSPVFSPVVP